jgi:hypothetical protein
MRRSGVRKTDTPNPTRSNEIRRNALIEGIKKTFEKTRYPVDCKCWFFFSSVFFMDPKLKEI